jgi:predicted XRE-type DNA-binding protein
MGSGRSSSAKRRVGAAIHVERSSGNVFADLGLPDAGQRLIKSEITICISQIMDRHGLTQTEAAKRLGVSQADVSDLVRGKLEGYSIERLLRFLNALGQDVDIIIPRRLRRGRSGRLRIHTEGRDEAPTRSRQKQ